MLLSISGIRILRVIGAFSSVAGIIVATAATPATQSLTRTFNGSGGSIPAAGFFGNPPGVMTRTVSTFTSGVCGTITDVDLRVVVGHTYISDLRVTISNLTTGTAVRVFDEQCASENHFDVQFDDEAANFFVCVSRLGGVHRRPRNPLSAFDGEAIRGTWQLEVSDHGFGDTGDLVDWDLIITYENSPPSGTISLTDSPDPAPADGVNTVRVSSGSMENECGVSVSGGTSVTVSTNFGTITTADADPSTAGIQVLTSGSTFQCDVVSLVAGNGTMTAQTVEGSALGVRAISFATETIPLSASPPSIPADGVSTALISTTNPIRDVLGVVLPSGTPVTVATSLGTITTPDADAADGIQVLTAGGIVQFILRSGVVPGSANVTIEPVVGEGFYGCTSISFDAPIVTVDIEAPCTSGPITLSATGQTNGRNSYASGSFSIFWSGAEWQIKNTFNPIPLATSSINSQPDPPNTALGNWQGSVACPGPWTVSGSGTQGVVPVELLRFIIE